jgi:hypothetical protein
MARLIYGGDHAAVFVVVDTFATIEAVKGDPVEVPDDLAANLLASGVWSDAATAKVAKSGKGKAAKNDDPADEAEKGTG